MNLRSALALTALALVSACSTPSFSAEPRFATFDVEGDFGISASGSVTEGDLETMGLEKDDSVFGARADLKFGGPHLTVSGQQSSHDGSGTADVVLTQGGVTIPIGASVDSELDLGLLSAVMTWDLVPTDMVEFGIGIGATYVDFDAAIEEQGTGMRVATDEAAPVPVLAARLGVDVGRLDLEALVSGLTGSYGDIDATFLDLEARARLNLIGGDKHLAGFLTAGYRLLKLDLEFEDDTDEVATDMEFSGPFVGLVVSI